MKKFFLLTMTALLLTSCSVMQKANFEADYGNICDQHFTPSSANFTYLGTFYGVSSQTTSVDWMKDDTGLIALAREHLMSKIEKTGISMSEGSKFLSNIAIERTTYENTITITVSADVFEIK